MEAAAAERRGRAELMALGVDVVSSSDTLFEKRTMEDSRPGEARSGLLGVFVQHTWRVGAPVSRVGRRAVPARNSLAKFTCEILARPRDSLPLFTA